MTKINLTTNNQTPDTFEPQQGNIFQVNSFGETKLVMFTDDNTVVTLTGTDAGYVDSADGAAYLARENLVNQLDIVATLDAL